MMSAREQHEEILKNVQHKKCQDRVFQREKARLLKVRFYACQSESQRRWGGENRVQSDRQAKERVEVRAQLQIRTQACSCT